MMFANLFVGRETKANYLFNVFFGTAIITVLVIRGFLAITNYPQLGGNGLHIAHMLWGGLFMLVSVVGLLYLHGRRVKYLAAFLAGAGFGFFIDELGKFITSDNDYFYRPTAMLIYIIFVILWGFFSWLSAYHAITPQQKAIDVFSNLRDAMIYGISPLERTSLERELVAAGCSVGEARRLMAIATNIAPPYDGNSFLQYMNRFKDTIKHYIHVIAAKKTTRIILGVIMILPVFPVFFDSITATPPETTPVFIQYGLITSMIAIGISTIVSSIYFLWRRPDRAFVWYRRSLLINIFGAQVFLFYTNQFQAAFGLIVNLVLFALVNEITLHAPQKKTISTS